jgi:hypothetical protein
LFTVNHNWRHHDRATRQWFNAMFRTNGHAEAAIKDVSHQGHDQVLLL